MVLPQQLQGQFGAVLPTSARGDSLLAFASLEVASASALPLCLKEEMPLNPSGGPIIWGFLGGCGVCSNFLDVGRPRFNVWL